MKYFWEYQLGPNAMFGRSLPMYRSGVIDAETYDDVIAKLKLGQDCLWVRVAHVIEKEGER